MLVFVIPVSQELDLKKAARAAGDKRAELIAVKDLLAATGYMRGSVSPLGMKKNYPTYIDASAEAYDYIVISAGKKGASVKLAPGDLAALLQAGFAALFK